MVVPVKDYLQVPSGTVIMHVHSDPLFGFLLCNGQTFDRDRFHRLYWALGNRNAVPNLINMYIRCADSQSRIGTFVVQSDRTGMPANKFKVNTTSLGSHRHFSSLLIFEMDALGGANLRAMDSGDSFGGGSETTDPAGNHFHVITTGGDGETRPPTLDLAFHIKT